MTGIFDYLRKAARTVMGFENWFTVLRSHFRPAQTPFVARLRGGTRFRIRPGRGDDYILREVFVERVYQRCLEQLPGGASVVVDIGANIGAFSVLAASQNPALTVYCYEPFAENYRLLQENIQLNGLDGRIRAFQCAVGAERQTKTVFLSVAGGASSMYEKRGQKVNLEVVALKDIFADNHLERCNLLKVDCEGSEYEVLYSTPEEVFARIDAIGMEFHEQFGTGTGEELRAFLESRGFQVDLEKGPPGYIYARKR